MAAPHPYQQELEGEIILYTYFRSSCSCRVRTACLLKGIPLTFRYVNLVKNEQNSSGYIDKIDPNGLVPTLIVKRSNGDELATVSQSMAILEYLEEAFPTMPPLLPPVSNPLRRAKVRELANIIACDVQPVTNLRVLKRVNGLGVSSQQWFQECMSRPFAAYEKLLQETAGRFSVGNEISLADVCLAPAVENALRWQVDLSSFPRIMGVFEYLRAHPAFVQGDWRHQGDTPEQLKAAG